MAAISITAASFVPSANAVTQLVTAAVAVTAGQSAYQLAAGTYGLCDNDASAPAPVFAGLFGGNAAAGQPVALVKSDTALVLGGTLVKGTVVCTSPTAGGVTLTPGDNTTGSTVTVIGIGTSTTTLNFAAPGYSAGSAI